VSIPRTALATADGRGERASLIGWEAVNKFKSGGQSLP
jgi:hypothetical protein